MIYTPVIQKINFSTHHNSGITWVSWHLKSLATRLLMQQLVQANAKENIKVPHHWAFCEGNPPVTHGPPLQRASKVENISMSWDCTTGLAWHDYIWELVCQKQVSRAGTSNYIPQKLWDVITYPCPWYLLLAYKSSHDESPLQSQSISQGQCQPVHCTASCPLILAVSAAHYGHLRFYSGMHHLCLAKKDDEWPKGHV